jgi:calcineurin-like phosphoesterase family protein
MHNVLFYSDPHFGHANILKFTGADGKLIRPGFRDIADHDEFLIARFNDRVGLHDKVYFLGDISFKLDRFHAIMPRLNGAKRLILGNHDDFKMSEYMKYFSKIRESWQPMRNILFTHRPVLMGEDDHHKKIVLNVHGHTHSHIISDDRYMNICVENTDYYPLRGSEIIEEYTKRGYKIG